MKKKIIILFMVFSMQIIGAADDSDDVQARLDRVNGVLDDIGDSFTQALEHESIATASFASSISHASMVNITALLAAKANPNGSHNDLLHEVCKIKTDNAGVVLRQLLEAKADPNARDTCGITPLFWARSASVVGLLVANKADVRCTSKNGHTALHGVIVNSPFKQGMNMVIRALNSRGVSVNAQTASGYTALHVLACVSRARDGEINKNEEHDALLGCARELLACGVDEALRTHEQKTALDLVKERNERLHCSLSILLKDIAQERAKIAGECEPFLPSTLRKLVARYAYEMSVLEEKK